MKMHRRVFFSALLFAAPRQRAVVEVSVMEAFNVAGRTVAVLAHHVDEAHRDQFAKWLRGPLPSTVRLQTADDRETSAFVFRVRLCFGRALLILRDPVRIREGDIFKVLV